MRFVKRCMLVANALLLLAGCGDEAVMAPNATVIGSVDTPDGAVGVAVAGVHAYVADWLVGLQIIDISDPTSPRSVGSVATPSKARGVVVAGDHAYVADWFSGLQVIDIGELALR